MADLSTFASAKEATDDGVIITKGPNGQLQDSLGNDIPVRSAVEVIAQGKVVVDQTSGNRGAVEIGQNYGGIQRWYLNAPTAGDGQSFVLGFPDTRRQTWLLIVSYKRNGSNRIDTEIHLVNSSGAAGSDLDTVIHSNYNSAGLDNANFSFNGSSMVLTVDLGQDGDQLTVTALG